MAAAKLRAMDPTVRDRADARLDQALERDALQDPRVFYRMRLRSLKERHPAAFDDALRYYEEVLLPRVAAEESDPIAEWFAYGLRLAELGGPGRVVTIDAEGRSRTYAPPLSPAEFVLFFPDDEREAVLVLSLPRDLSGAQRATYDLLIAGAREPTEPG